MLDQARSWLITKMPTAVLAIGWLIQYGTPTPFMVRALCWFVSLGIMAASVLAMLDIGNGGP